MDTQKYPKEFLTLIQYLKKFPGIGNKSAQKMAFHLLNWEGNALQNLSQIISELKQKIKKCPECGSLLSFDLCPFCASKNRQSDLLCVVASPKDVYLIEETASYQGLYHVIDHLLSPHKGFSEEGLHLDQLKKRIEKLQTKEVILAFDSTLEGDATSLYFKKHLTPFKINISRLAFGLPVGSSLEFTDGGTLSRALLGRQKFV